MCQSQYASKLNPLETFSGFEAFRSLRHKMAWLGHTRPDVISPVHILSQVTPKTFEAKHIRIINGVMKRVKVNEKRGIKQHRLDKKGLKKIVYTY